MPLRVSSRLAWLVPFAALLAGARGQAMNADDNSHPALPASPASHATPSQALDLRLPPGVGQSPHVAAAAGVTAIQSPRTRTLQLEPRKSFLERGVEGSREALIACQRGAYPGATVAASTVQTTAGDAQPDHCYRF